MTRITGANRYAVASRITQEFDRRPARAYVATGTAFPDALVGAARRQHLLPKRTNQGRSVRELREQGLGFGDLRAGGVFIA